MRDIGTEGNWMDGASIRANDSPTGRRSSRAPTDNYLVRVAMKTVKTFSNLAEAGFADSLLEAAGIPALLADEQSFLWSYGVAIPIRLQVEDAEFERARQVLERGLQAAEDAPPSAAAALTRAGRRRNSSRALHCRRWLFALMAFAIHNTFEDRKPPESRDQNYEADYNHDGRADYFETYTGNRIISSKGDRNFDGQIDEWFFFDNKGQATRGEIDQKVDGRPDVWITYRDGVQETFTEDTDFNGVTDWITTFTHGIRARSEARPNDSGTVSRTQLYRSGVLYEERVDEDRDGKFDYRILYDPYGSMSERMPLEEAN